MRALALGIVAWLTACGEPAIEMKLVMPPAASTPFDMSCVGAVDLLPIPKNDAKALDIGNREDELQARLPCVGLPHAPASFDDLETMVHGQFDIALPPEGLAGIELRGRAGTCDEIPAYHEAIFYGGAIYKDGESSIDIKLAHNISCDAGTTYTVRAVDLVNLVTTKQCAEVTNAGSQIFAGAVRPTLLETMEPAMFEGGASHGNVTAGTVSIDTYKSTWAGTCPAVGWQDAAFDGTASCINPGATACGQAGEIEIATASTAFTSASADQALEQQFGAAQMGAVWTTTGTVGPVAGATITLDMGATGKVVYGDPSATKFQPAAAATTTTASGMYMIYADGVVGATFSAPGKAPRHVWLGGVYELWSTAIVVVN